MRPSINTEKNICSKSHTFLFTSNASLGKFGSKIIEGRFLNGDLRYLEHQATCLYNQTLLTKLYLLLQNWPYYISTWKSLKMKRNIGKFILNAKWVTYFLTCKFIRLFVISVQQVYLDYTFIKELEIFCPTRLFGLHFY